MPARVHTQASPLTLPLDGLSRWESLRHFLPLGREAIRLLEQAGRFPKRTRITERCSAWSNAEIHRWLKDPAGYRAEAK